MKKIIVFLLISSLIPSFLFAHDEGGSGFISGLTHPVLGLDHLLAMISVGILSAQIGGRAILLVPSVFVVVMLIGGLIGIQGNVIPYVELAIALSVIVLGLAIMIEKKFPILITMIFVGVFAFFHGNAHGLEMPTLAHPIMYAGGFVLGTTLIHLLVFLSDLLELGLQIVLNILDMRVLLLQEWDRKY